MTDPFNYTLRNAIRQSRDAPGFPGIPVTLTNTNQGLSYTLQQIQDLNPNNIHLSLHVNRSYLTLTNSSIRRILENLRDETVEELKGDYPGEIIDAIMHGDGDLQLYVSTPRVPTYMRQAGSFFKFINQSWLDLDRYGIFRSVEDITFKHHCLVEALIVSELFPQDVIDEATLLIHYKPFPRCKLDTLATTLNTTIRLTTYNKNSEHVVNYPQGVSCDRPILKLCLFQDHYFLNEQTVYTSDDVLHCMLKPEYPHSGRRLNSSRLISLLFDNEAFKEMELTQLVFEHELDRHLNAQDIPIIDPQPSHFDVVTSTSTTIEELDAIVFFDIETDPISDPRGHIPYAVSWCINDSNATPEFLMIQDKSDVDRLGRSFLERLYYQIDSRSDVRRIVLVAHNAQYDLQILLRCCHPLKVLKNGTRLKTWTGVFFPERYGTKKLYIYLRDSYLMIPTKLSEFSSIFSLDSIKEWFPYELYTIDNIVDKKFLPLPLPELIGSRYARWYHIGLSSGWITENEELHMENYARYYTTLDVKILSQGYYIYREWMKTITGLDIIDHITLSHLAKNFMISEKCFKDVYSIGQNVMMFIRQSVVGGRTMVASNRSRIIEAKIEDQDVNSLYPTAMTRMSGFLKGFAKRLPHQFKYCSRDQFIPFLKKVDGCFIKIVITAVGKLRSIPTLCFKNVDGCVVWDNDLVYREIVVCKTMLEDLIEYHQINFNVIDGYYYDQGFNTSIRDIVESVYKVRIDYKNNNNPIQYAYKLLLNSFYGVTLTNPPDVEHKFSTKKNMDTFYVRHHAWIEKVTEYGLQYYPEFEGDNNEVEHIEFQLVRSLRKVSNLPHVGAEILAWSKRHMNEIIYLADDNNIPIYYTDTDSVHMLQDDIEKLGALFYHAYNRTLFGSALGQCSSEWSDGIYAIKSYFLAKKIYLDVLNDHTLHFAMKGVKHDAILAYAHLNHMSIPDVYQNLYDGGYLEFHNGHNERGEMSRTSFKRNANGIFTCMEEEYLKKRIRIHNQ